ncbi:periplasmic chaperone for outer membrane proteins Skp [Deinococcus reticulitermitis]|uniref:Periplasmic chaperone for outer membrane proteins Skp n=1 Tax=Deinococcus reticulitermitis TaxID=856736 RepID=A0A1H6S5V9_9DEIO|nr:OmpH family outer membrane protein [Deinococcus reticulitermitis]SEI59390.1 periplasmic chaperone for outer membrane proteins Skp [Deinococcus reticulitermitis]
MKITPKALAPIALIAAFGLGTLAPNAQTSGQKVGFVNVDTLFAAHPSDKDIKALQATANKELGDLDARIKAIDAKGNAATAADKTQREQLVSTINAKAKSFNDQMSAKATPVENSVDKALSDYAKANGFAIIMDRAIAQQSGLVVYADNSTDVTDGVKKNVK